MHACTLESQYDINTSCYSTKNNWDEPDSCWRGRQVHDWCLQLVEWLFCWHRWLQWWGLSSYTPRQQQQQREAQKHSVKLCQCEYLGDRLKQKRAPPPLLLYMCVSKVFCLWYCSLTDISGIQYRVLNRKKGPAVWVRFQNCDIRNQLNLTLDYIVVKARCLVEQKT